jgi:hypothetical protein
MITLSRSTSNDSSTKFYNVKAVANFIAASTYLCFLLMFMSLLMLFTKINIDNLIKEEITSEILIKISFKAISYPLNAFWIVLFLLALSKIFMEQLIDKISSCVLTIFSLIFMITIILSTIFLTHYLDGDN